MSKVPTVTPQNCHNDSQITFQQQFYTNSLNPSFSAASAVRPPLFTSLSVFAFAGLAWFLL